MSGSSTSQYGIVHRGLHSDAGQRKSFQVKVGLHQGSVLSPLLFSIVMGVVSSEARSGLPSELMYADDVVLTGTNDGTW